MCRTMQQQAAAPSMTVHQAALRGDVEALSAMTVERDVATPEGFTPLSLAVSAGKDEAVKWLLREGVACVDHQDFAGTTALMHAAMHGYAELVNLLLLHGAQAGVRRNDGMTAVSLAAQYGRPAALGAFFRADAALVEASDGVGRTPLHWAVLSRHPPTVKYILGRWGANVTAVDDKGCQPLHLCCGPPEVLLLLYHGTAHTPSLSVTNARGERPAEAVASAGGDEALVCLLRDAATVLSDGTDADGGGASGRSRLLHLSRAEARLFAFMPDSPQRLAPRPLAARPWPLRLSAPEALGLPLPFAFFGATLCGLSLSGSVSVLSAALLLCVLPSVLLGDECGAKQAGGPHDSRRPTALLPCSPASLLPCSPANRPAALLQAGGPHDAPRRIAVPGPAIALADVVLLMAACQAFVFAPSAPDELRALTALTSAVFVAYIAAYAWLLSRGPGAIEGADCGAGRGPRPGSPAAGGSAAERLDERRALGQCAEAGLGATPTRLAYWQAVEQMRPVRPPRGRRVAVA